MVGLKNGMRVGHWATTSGASCVPVLKLSWGTMVRLVKVGVSTLVTTAVVVAMRGLLLTVCRKRRACSFAAKAVRRTVRQDAALPMAEGFAVVTQFAELGGDTATNIDKGFGAVL